MPTRLVLKLSLNLFTVVKSFQNSHVFFYARHFAYSTCHSVLWRTSSPRGLVPMDAFWGEIANYNPGHLLVGEADVRGKRWVFRPHSPRPPVCSRPHPPPTHTPPLPPRARGPEVLGRAGTLRGRRAICYATAKCHARALRSSPPHDRGFFASRRALAECWNSSSPGEHRVGNNADRMQQIETLR